MFPKSIEPVSVMLQGTLRDGWSEEPLVHSGVAHVPVHAVGLHYGQIAFEALRARHLGGRTEVFRVDLHRERLRRSMERLSMPPIDATSFDRVLASLLAEIRHHPDDPEQFLYVRPIVIATDADWSMGGAESFELHVLAGWTREAFARVPSVVAQIEAERRRTWPGGTGDVKIPSNYGPAFAVQREARRSGAHTVLWLDPAQRDVEEFTSMNAVVVDDQGVLRAPAPGSTVLDGVTRRSVVELAADLGVPVDDGPLRWPDPWQDPDGLHGALMATGTAAGMAVVDEVREVSPSGEVRSWRSSGAHEHLAHLQDAVRACFGGHERSDWWTDVDGLRQGVSGTSP